MDREISGELWYWRGPAPYYFVTVPEDACVDLRAVARSVTYGWGMIPVTVEIGDTEWDTSLFPKNGGYIVPIRDSVRNAEEIEDGDEVTLRLTIRQ